MYKKNTKLKEGDGPNKTKVGCMVWFPLVFFLSFVGRNRPVYTKLRQLNARTLNKD